MDANDTEECRRKIRGQYEPKQYVLQTSIRYDWLEEEYAKKNGFKVTEPCNISNPLLFTLSTLDGIIDVFPRGCYYSEWSVGIRTSDEVYNSGPPWVRHKRVICFTSLKDALDIALLIKYNSGFRI